MKILLSLLCCVGVFTLSAQSRYFKRKRFMASKRVEACKPVLTYTEHKPVKRVTSIKDASPTKVGACGTKEARICYSMSP